MLRIQMRWFRQAIRVGQFRPEARRLQDAGAVTHREPAERTGRGRGCRRPGGEAMVMQVYAVRWHAGMLAVAFAPASAGPVPRAVDAAPDNTKTCESFGAGRRCLCRLVKSIAMDFAPTIRAEPISHVE